MQSHVCSYSAELTCGCGSRRWSSKVGAPKNSLSELFLDPMLIRFLDAALKVVIKSRCPEIICEDHVCRYVSDSMSGCIFLTGSQKVVAQKFSSRITSLDAILCQCLVHFFNGAKIGAENSFKVAFLT